MQKWLYNFADTRLRAIPRDSNDSLPSLLAEDDQVQNTTRKQGNRISAMRGISYQNRRALA